MSTTTTVKYKTCEGCGHTGLRWQKSNKGRWYLAEHTLNFGYTGQAFHNWTLHKCPGRPSLNTPPVTPVTVYGRPEGPLEHPDFHRHAWQPWRQAKGSTVSGAWCQGCRGLMVN